MLGNQGFDLGAGRGVFDLLRVEQGHGVRLDGLGDDELHAGEPDTVVRQETGFEGEFRVAEVEHDRRAWPAQFAEIDAGGFEGDGAVIDASDIALGAGDRDRPAVFQDFGRARGADDGGDAELAGDDGGVAGAAAAVGDNRRGRLHDRLPVGRGGVGDQDLAGSETVQLALAVDHPHLTAGDLGADGAAGQQHRRRALQHVVFQDLALALAGHRLGPRLHDIEFAVQAVLGPLDVHRHAMAGALRVVLLDLDRGVGQGQDVGVADAEALPVRLRRRDDSAGLAGMAVGVDHLELLLAATAAEYGPMALLEGRLVNVVLVRVDRALNDGFAQSVGTGDENHVGKAGFGIDREDDAAGCQIRTDHLHHRHRQRDLEVVEVALDAIADRPVGEERRQAALVGIDQQGLAAHVQVGIVLACEARGRQVLCGGRGADRHTHVLAVFRDQCAPAFADLLLDLAR